MTPSEFSALKPGNRVVLRGDPEVYVVKFRVADGVTVAPTSALA